MCKWSTNVLTRFIKIYLSKVQSMSNNLISYQKYTFRYSWNYAYTNVRTPLTGTKNDYKWGEFGRKRGNAFYLKRSKAPKLRRRLITPQGLCFSRRRTWNIFCCYPRADFFLSLNTKKSLEWFLRRPRAKSAVQWVY